MLKRAIITNYLGASIEYSFDNPTIDEESGLFITEIEGLGPVKADINMTSLATADGDIYNSSRLQGRNIVISARFTYAKTIEEARLMSYKYFPIGKKVKFQIETDSRFAETEGFVESNEPNIFSNESDVKISILCESSFFLASGNEAQQDVDFSAVEFLFEFPFSNESVVEKLLEFGNIVNKKENTVYYDGDSETGCIIKIHATGNVEMVRIFNIKTRETMVLDTDKLATLTGQGFIYGDTITINTIKGHKSIFLLREGISTNILNILGKDSDWFQLAKGDNLFAFTAEYGEQNIQFTVTTQIAYEGV